MAGFVLKNTLSSNGAVTRGICYVPWRRGRDFESIRGVLKIERFISEFDRENFEVDGVEFNYIGVGFAADVHGAFDKVAGAVDFEIEVVMLGGEILKKSFHVYIIYQI